MEDQGLEDYIKHMVDSENTPLAPGPAFAFVQAIEAVNLGNKLFEEINSLDPWGWSDQLVVR